MVRTITLKPSAKNNVGGTTSPSCLPRNARRPGLGGLAPGEEPIPSADRMSENSFKHQQPGLQTSPLSVAALAALSSEPVAGPVVEQCRCSPYRPYQQPDTTLYPLLKEVAHQPFYRPGSG